jgi:hypothetical protein
VDEPVAVLFTDFLFFLTCFLAAGAALAVGLAAGFEVGAWAASDNPAVARVRERPITAEVIVFIFGVPFEAIKLSASVLIDARNC